MAEINLTGDFATQFFDNMINALSDSSLQTIMEFTGRAVGVAAESVVSEYPPASGKPLEKFYDRVDAKGHTYKSKFKSLRQQKYVMALGARGGIPYRRTGQLGRSITSDIRDLSSNGVTVIIGTNDPKAKFVIGTPEEGQNRYFANVWTPLSDDISQNANKLNAIANIAFSTAVRKELL